jgi:hypothetical protein
MVRSKTIQEFNNKPLHQIFLDVAVEKAIIAAMILQQNYELSTYGHSQLKTGHPVRSAIHKQLNGRLVLRWVTTWESLLLYVLFLCWLSSVFWLIPFRNG